MPGGRILRCESDGPLGAHGPRRAVVFLESGASGEKHGRCPVLPNAELGETAGSPVTDFRSNGTSIRSAWEG